MTWPEDARPAGPARKAPNLAVGYLLNALLPGAGFTYIGLVGWHAGWMALLIGLTVLGAVLTGVTSAPLFTLLPVLGWAAQLAHFGRAYAAQAKRSFRPELDNGMKIGLIAVHLVLNTGLLAVVAAVVLPNLMGARLRAEAAGERAAASSAYTRVLSAASDGTLRSGPCPLEDVSGRHRISSCRVVLPDASTDMPQVTVTFTSGHTIHLP